MISKSNNDSYHDGTSAFFQRFFQKIPAPYCRWVFSVCNGLNNARDTLINGKINENLGIINMNQIRDLTKIKGEIDGV